MTRIVSDPSSFTEKLANTLKDKSAWTRVVVDEKGKVTTRWDFIFHFIPRLLTRKAVEENRKTLRVFFEVFGSRRVVAIGRRYGINFADRLQRGIGLTKEDLEKLFVGLADVREEDLKEAISCLKHDETMIGLLQSLKDEELRLWQNRVSDRELEDLSAGQVDRLIQILVPFKKIQHLFIHNVPRKNKAVREAGKTFASRKEAVYYEELFRRKARKGSMKEEDRIYILAKRILDREPPVGTIVGYPGGWYKVYKIWNAGGAYAILFKPLTLRGGLTPIIGFRGTRVTSGLATDNFLTGLDDLRKCAGAKGAIRAYWGLKKLITDPDEGFIACRGQRVNLFGMSLGGNHAQNLAATDLIRNIKSVVTVCSLGIHDKVREAFTRRSEQLPRPVEVTHIVEDDDVVPDIGHGHVSSSHTRHITLSLKKTDGLRPAYPTGFLSIVRAMFHLFVRCLFNTHTRETVHYRNHQRVERSSHHSSGERRRILEIVDNKADENRKKWQEWHDHLTFGGEGIFYKFLKEKTNYVE